MPLTRKVTGEKPDVAKMVRAEAQRIAGKAAQVIAARVAKGLDVNDRPFAPYDREYAQTNGSRVDLGGLVAGGMLATLVVTVVVRGSDAVITVKPAPKWMKVGALLHSGTPLMRARPWLGFSPRDLVVLNKS